MQKPKCCDNRFVTVAHAGRDYLQCNRCGKLFHWQDEGWYHDALDRWALLALRTQTEVTTFKPSPIFSLILHEVNNQMKSPQLSLFPEEGQQ